MSRWDAVSDLDYEAEQGPQRSSVVRTCSRCGAEMDVPVTGPYVVQWTCPACWNAMVRRTLRETS